MHYILFITRNLGTSFSRRIRIPLPKIISPICELGARLRERLPDHQFMTVKLSIIYIIKGILRRWDLHLSNYCPWDIYGPSLLGFFLPREIFDFFYLICFDHSLQILKLLHNKKNIFTKWSDASFVQGHNKTWISGLFENFKLKPRNVYVLLPKKCSISLKISKKDLALGLKLLVSLPASFTI